MDFICDKQQLLENIAIVEKAVSKTSAPITSCILMTATEDGYFLTGNNFEMAVKTSLIPADIKKPGSIVLEAQIFYEMIKRLPDSIVHIYNMSGAGANENIVRITSGKTDYKIMTVNEDEFTGIAEFEKTARCSVKSSVLRNMIRQTIFSVSIDESKPVFTGELFKAEDGFFITVALDGFRVAFRRTADCDCETRISAVIPAKTLNEILKILPQNDESMIHLYFSQSVIAFCAEAFTMTSRLIEGEFFKYENLLGADYKTLIKINRPDFISSIDRVSLMPGRDGKKNAVKLSIQDGLVVVSSKTDMGTAQDEVYAAADGEPLDIAFNPRYLTDALKAIDEDTVEITFTTPLAPCTIKPVGGGDAVYIVVPLRLQQ